MEKKNKNKKEEEVCPEGNNPIYCPYCREARNQEWKEQDKFRRKIHGLN